MELINLTETKMTPVSELELIKAASQGDMNNTAGFALSVEGYDLLVTFMVAGETYIGHVTSGYKVDGRAKCEIWPKKLADIVNH